MMPVRSGHRFRCDPIAPLVLLVIGLAGTPARAQVQPLLRAAGGSLTVVDLLDHALAFDMTVGAQLGGKDAVTLRVLYQRHLRLHGRTGFGSLSRQLVILAYEWSPRASTGSDVGGFHGSIRAGAGLARREELERGWVIDGGIVVRYLMTSTLHITAELDGLTQILPRDAAAPCYNLVPTVVQACNPYGGAGGAQFGGAIMIGLEVRP